VATVIVHHLGLRAGYTELRNEKQRVPRPRQPGRIGNNLRSPYSAGFQRRPIVSRQGIVFDYSSPAELYLSRRRGRHPDYRRFATAAEAIAYGVEELHTRRSNNARMQVGDEQFNNEEINRPYDDDDNPLRTQRD
jgi:hypothetical protein